MTKTRIAIACQGGGAHTAFTAGVLKHLLEKDIQSNYQIVGLTGTSGGAVCATATLYGLLKAANGGTEPPHKPLVDFWYANTPQSPMEAMFAKTTDTFMRIAETGRIPTFPANPYKTTPALEAAMPLFERREFLDFRALLETHIDFAELHSLIDEDSPRLLLGAANILTGEFKAFDSWVPGEISVEAVLASAAVPNIFEAVHHGDGVYWDGLFSQNPPVAQLIKADVAQRPDEIWVILINPITADEEPKTPGAIADRRNELAGNISLYQELSFINVVNEWIEQGYFKAELAKKLKPIKIRVVKMSKHLSDSLNYWTKLSRDRKMIDTLIADGENQASEFLTELEPAKAPKAA